MVEIVAYSTKSLIEVNPRTPFRLPRPQPPLFANYSNTSSGGSDQAYFSYNYSDYGGGGGVGVSSGSPTDFCSYFRTKCTLCARTSGDNNPKSSSKNSNRSRQRSNTKTGNFNGDLCVSEEEQEVSAFLKEIPCKSPHHPIYQLFLFSES